MLTIKLPISISSEDQELILNLQRQQSCVIRSTYSVDLGEKALRLKFKGFNSIQDLDSWFIQSGIREGLGMRKADQELGVIKRIFGGKKNLKLRSENKISSEDWKARRLLPIYLIGESPYFGNRKFELEIFASNSIIFKPRRGVKISLKLPNLKKKMREQLLSLECAANEQILAVTYRLTCTHVCITFNETLISKIKKIPLRQDLCLGIDMNPNWIGTSIQDSSGQVLDTRLFDLTKLTKKSSLESSHRKSKYLNNKLDFETIEIAKSIIDFAKSRHVGMICLEDLKFKQGDKGIGRNFNRLTSNVWKRSLFARIIEKYAVLNGIKVRSVNAAYSSTIGNLLNPEFPDPVASSIEVARRGLSKKFYPELISTTKLEHRWKEASTWGYDSWTELHQILKNLKVKYRVPVPEGAVFREMSNRKSLVLQVSF